MQSERLNDIGFQEGNITHVKESGTLGVPKLEVKKIAKY